jgi:FMN phosphatase YigB (HAD superfamily)
MATPITDIIFDFDGTCTQIPVIADAYLERYLQGFNDVVTADDASASQKALPFSDQQWHEAQQQVRQHSPIAGWMLGGSPAAPAAADPYILADESLKYLLRQREGTPPVLPSLHKLASDAHPAPWRPEALSTFSELIARGCRLHFISNSSTATVHMRLEELLGNDNPLSAAITVQSNAAKFQICELAWDAKHPVSAAAAARFAALPAVHNLLGSPYRPIYLRRGAYFEAICREFANSLPDMGSTLFCGDIWEMDLAMPYTLGAAVHLIERAAPFPTDDFERNAIASSGPRARISTDLTGLLTWF